MKILVHHLAAYSDIPEEILDAFKQLTHIKNRNYFFEVSHLCHENLETELYPAAVVIYAVFSKKFDALFSPQERFLIDQILKGLESDYSIKSPLLFALGFVDVKELPAVLVPISNCKWGLRLLRHLLETGIQLSEADILTIINFAKTDQISLEDLPDFSSLLVTIVQHDSSPDGLITAVVSGFIFDKLTQPIQTQSSSSANASHSSPNLQLTVQNPKISSDPNIEVALISAGVSGNSSDVSKPNPNLTEKEKEKAIENDKHSQLMGALLPAATLMIQSFELYRDALNELGISVAIALLNDPNSFSSYLFAADFLKEFGGFDAVFDRLVEIARNKTQCPPEDRRAITLLLAQYVHDMNCTFSDTSSAASQYSSYSARFSDFSEEENSSGSYIVESEEFEENTESSESQDLSQDPFRDPSRPQFIDQISEKTSSGAEEKPRREKKK